MNGITAPKAVLPAALDDIPRLLNPLACRDWLLGQLHPDGPTCPTCGRALDDPRAARRFFALRAIKCDACDARFTAFTGTVFSGAQMPPEDITLMLLLFKLGQRDPEIGDTLDLNRSTVSRWRRVLNEYGAGI
ncbi:MAG: helix-turn-helix domain-containing protein [Solidesulfovibrio sp.]